MAEPELPTPAGPEPADVVVGELMPLDRSQPARPARHTSPLEAPEVRAAGQAANPPDVPHRPEVPDQPTVPNQPTVPDPATVPDQPRTAEAPSAVVRPGPAVLAADSWDAPAPPSPEHENYQGRRRASVRLPPVWLVVVLVLVAVGAATAFAVAREPGPGVAVGTPPTTAGNADRTEEISDRSSSPGEPGASGLPEVGASPLQSSASPAPAGGPVDQPPAGSPSPPATTAPPVVTLLSRGRPTATSALEGSSLAGPNAVDGNLGTRWGSAFSDPQWISVDLGSVCSITRVRLTWESAYARAYEIQTSLDNTSWTTVYSTATGVGGVDEVTVAATGRWVRVYGTQRATQYGYSLWELEVFGHTT